MEDRNKSIHIPERDFKKRGKVKIYPDNSFEILAASRPIFGGSGWEVSGDKPQIKKARTKKAEPSAADLERSRRRAAASVRDIALCTDFDYFVTLTLSPEMVDRYSIEDAVHKMKSWLDNRVRRNGLRYILVPELHKDGAIHFHGFFNKEGATFVDSGTLKIQGQKRPKKVTCVKTCAELIANGAQIVYNIADWSLGFSTAIPLYGERAAAVAYCCKYVTKQLQKIGGRWYYSGGDLKRPDTQYVDISYRELEALGAYTFQIEGAGCSMAILRGDDIERVFSDDTGI